MARHFSTLFCQAGLALALLPLTVTAALPQACGMGQIARHGDPARTAIFATSAGEKAILFTADLDVNTDGAARSYHPDDPRGRSVALNNMGNAITRIFDAGGRNITCSPRSRACFTRFMTSFEAARDAGYAPSGHPRIETDGIIPWTMDPARGWAVPCTIASGPTRGFFVAQTALLADSRAGLCDPARYVDALTMNAIVLPRNADWRAQGLRTDLGDVTVTLDLDTGRMAYAVTGDIGPAAAIGEGTVALAAALGGQTVSPTATYAEIRALARPRVASLIFPARDVPRATGGHFTQADIDRMGAEALAAYGGVERLRACLR